MKHLSTTWFSGLRAKSMLALALACLLALLPAVLIGWQVLDGVRNYFGESYARNFTLLKRQSILAPVSRELALSLRLTSYPPWPRFLRFLFQRDASPVPFFRGSGGAVASA